jgi:hypothetical protein
LKIADPNTVLTDWILAALTAWLAWRLFRQAVWLKDRAIRLWVGAFCAVVGSAALGGMWHGFSAAIDPSFAPLLWTGAMVLASTASLLFLLSTLRVYTSGRALDAFAALAVAKFALFAICAAVTDDFRMVVYDSALTMLVMLGLSAWGAWVRRIPSAAWVLAGVLVSMLGALFEQGRVSVHRQFNYNDLWHVLQMGALYLLFRGGLLLREQEPAASDFEATRPLPIAGKE